MMVEGDLWKDKYVPKTEKMFIQKRAKNRPLVRSFYEIKLVHILTLPFIAGMN